MSRPTPSRIADKVARLRSLLADKSTMLVVMQDYPDPDAIGSAAGLRALANALAGVQCTLAHGGMVGRAENRALARYLGLNLRCLAEVDFGRFGAIALIDTQPGTGNNSLPEEVVPDIVIDHHPIRRATRSAPFTDIRSHYGATSTIVYEYLAHAGVKLDVTLATALLYGIRSDTQDLGREAIRADIDALLALYPQANQRMLGRIQYALLPDSYFRMLAAALAKATVHGASVVADIGPADSPDMIGEVADLLHRWEQAEAVLCHGFHDGKVRFSIRTADPAMDAGVIARRIAGRMGSAGGHSTFAAGQIPLPGPQRRKQAAVGRMISARFLRAVGATETSARKLVPAD